MIVKLNVMNLIQTSPGNYRTGDPDEVVRVVKTLMDHQFIHRTLKLKVGEIGDDGTVEAIFEDPMEAAIFLATISAGPDRASLFKMFWGDSK